MHSDCDRTLDSLDVIRRAPTLLAALDSMDSLMQAASTEGAATTELLKDTIANPDDDLAAIAAVHAAGVTGAATATQIVVPLLASSAPHLREHAAWALASAPPLPEAVPSLVDMVTEGGFTGTLAEATLESWGLGPHTIQDPEDAAHDQATGHEDTGTGFTVAQMYLHADVDGTLSAAGQGDTGGIATLLVHLGDALLKEGTIDRVLTLSRGRSDRAAAPEDLAGPGHHYLSVPLPGPVRRSADAWPLHLLVRRELRRILVSAGRIDVLHLRMADVGAWAAYEVARDLGITTVLTLAPDPHALIASRDEAGTLTRQNFGEVDHEEHLVFRFRLLRDLAAQAAHLVVFPRPHLARDLKDLLHLDPSDTDRITAVPEGIDVAPLNRAASEVARALRGEAVSDGTASAMSDLDDILARLPEGRRGLPLAISVGRLHPVKGMATLVEAWATDPLLKNRCNLLIVGGDLGSPSADEGGQLEHMDRVVPRADGPQRGLLLAGHRPNSTVAVWLASVLRGRPGLATPGGVYISASLKEEFGLAILEAMASGLVVVAPHGGGPATYVEQGVTGVLAHTGSLDALGTAMTSALDLASAPDAEVRAHRARSLITRRFSIQTMAAALATIYTKVAS